MRLIAILSKVFCPEKKHIAEAADEHSGNCEEEGLDEELKGELKGLSFKGCEWKSPFALLFDDFDDDE